MNNKYYFCYSIKQHQYIHNTKRIPYVCSALHESTGNKFWLYENTDELTQAIKEQKQLLAQR